MFDFHVHYNGSVACGSLLATLPRAAIGTDIVRLEVTPHSDRKVPGRTLRSHEGGGTHAAYLRSRESWRSPDSKASTTSNAAVFLVDSRFCAMSMTAMLAETSPLHQSIETGCGTPGHTIIVGTRRAHSSVPGVLDRQVGKSLATIQRSWRIAVTTGGGDNRATSICSLALSRERCLQDRRPIALQRA